MGYMKQKLQSIVSINDIYKNVGQKFFGAFCGLNLVILFVRN